MAKTTLEATDEELRSELHRRSQSPAFRIKPLRWKPDTSCPLVQMAVTPFGIYRAYMAYWIGPRDATGVAKSQDDAKACCQDHYESTLLPCLLPIERTP